MKSENTVRKDSAFITTHQLKEMGINNPFEITGYSLFQVDNEDVLKIHYKRHQGSILPSSRKYKFGRSLKTIVTDSGKPGYEQVYEISPNLQQALTELDGIIASKKDLSDRKKFILEELDSLQQEVTSKFAELREQIESLSGERDF